MPRRIVIDTDIAQAANDKVSLNPRPKLCRLFLEAVRKRGHSIVITSNILDEWKRHRSYFSYRWLNTMHGRKRVEVISEDIEDQNLRNRIAQVAQNENEHQAIIKDCHLIEAAIITDKTIASLDETARSFFSKAATTVYELIYIMWVNPEREEEQVANWLESGAPVEAERCLNSP